MRLPKERVCKREIVNFEIRLICVSNDVYIFMLSNDLYVAMIMLAYK